MICRFTSQTIMDYGTREFKYLSMGLLHNGYIDSNQVSEPGT